MNIITEQMIADAKSFDELLRWQRGIRVATGIDLGELLVTRDQLKRETIISFPQYSSLKIASRDVYSAMDIVTKKLYSDKAQNECFMNLGEDEYDTDSS